jgi:hypothetical protein
MPDNTSPDSDTDRIQLPEEPPMLVVTKGWWTWKEELVPRKVLEAQNREAEEKRRNRRSLKSIIFGRR